MCSKPANRSYGQRSPRPRASPFPGSNFLPGSLHFLIGYNGTGYAGHAIGVKVNVADGYGPSRPNETIGSDWALVSLNKSLDSADRVLPIPSDLPENGVKVILGGY
jgi:hypothetical protein